MSNDLFGKILITQLLLVTFPVMIFASDLICERTMFRIMATQSVFIVITVLVFTWG